jgi:hypothetical protein
VVRSQSLNEPHNFKELDQQHNAAQDSIMIKFKMLSTGSGFLCSELEPDPDLQYS